MFRFLTHEIGSLAKPNWRVKALTNKPLVQKDLEEVERWGKLLGLDIQPLKDLLKKGNFGSEEKKQIIHWSSLFAVRLLEKAGLDYVFDGEQHRTEMYEYPIRHIEGMRFLGSVRSFDNKYYRKAACTSPLRLKKPYHTEEFLLIHQIASKPVKIPLTGAHTLMDWSFDEYYCRDILPWDCSSLSESRKAFLKDMAEQVIRPNIQSLVEAGTEWIQIDEPSATTHPEEVPMFLQSFHQSIHSFSAQFSIHICFSDYAHLLPHIFQIPDTPIFSLALEFANRDSKEPGITEEKRPGYSILKRFADQELSFKIGLGVVDIHTDFVEPVELIRDRILYGVKLLKDPEKILVTPDCGLRTRTWEIAYEKLCRMTEASHLASNLL